MEDGLIGIPGDPARKEQDRGTEIAQIQLQRVKGNHVLEMVHRKHLVKVLFNILTLIIPGGSAIIIVFNGTPIMCTVSNSCRLGLQCQTPV